MRFLLCAWLAVSVLAQLAQSPGCLDSNYQNYLNSEGASCANLQLVCDDPAATNYDVKSAQPCMPACSEGFWV
jgi:hypothetical protein